jgi:hypothetical protein
MSTQTTNGKNISKKAYYEPFEGNAVGRDGKPRLELALERAWNNRDFEIDKYWSRATYFWAFIAATFAGYIAVMASDKMQPRFQNELAFVIICMGVVFSSSWLMVNVGSKKWQENWEKHIDMLEDRVTGPIYKTVWNERAFSVSRINIYVSRFVIGVWGLLAIVQALGVPYNTEFKKLPLDWVMIVAALGTGLFIWRLYSASNRPSPDEKHGNFTFERRPIHFNGPEE